MIKRLVSIILLAVGVQASWGFALLGPAGNGEDSWQTATIGYDLAYVDEGLPGGPVYLGDIGGPKNYFDGYRRNVPVLYYACDAAFLNYFGSNGLAAVDAAFGVVNAITNVDSYSTNLSEFPLNSEEFNYTAQSLYLTDLKSATLHVLVEQLGLAEPERYTWTLAERYLPPGGTCPIDEFYTVIQRNYFDTPTAANQIQYSSYVNNTLYSFYIVENCTGPTPLAFTVPFAVDTKAQAYTAVAANNGAGNALITPSGAPVGAASDGGGLQLGGYYTGLTQDDVAGLRFLLSTNMIKWENIPSDNALTVSITNQTQALFPVSTATNSGIQFNGIFYGTGSLNALLSFAKTNDPTLVPIAFPGVQVNLLSNSFTNILVTNIISYFTNYIGSPAGSPPVLVTLSNIVHQPMEYFYDTFPNIITNSYFTNTVYQLVTTTVAPPNGAPAGSPSVTNTTTKLATNNTPSGDFYVLPTNAIGCGVDLVYTFDTFTNYLTNVISTTASTNSTTTNATSAFTLSQVIPYIGHVFVAQDVTCEQTPGSTNLYPGIQRVQFIRADFDSLVGQYWQPVTNNYTRFVYTNSQMVLQHFQRIATQPDFLLTANDQIAANTFNGTIERTINFDQTTVPTGAAGPGVIDGSSTISYNKIGDAFRNGSPANYPNYTFLNELTEIPTAAWGSFDGTTNAPVLYPNGNSIQNLMNEILIHVSPTTVPNGTAGTAYQQGGTNIIFTAWGGAFTPPYTWSATGLPTGMTLTTDTTVDPNGDGMLSGTPGLSGTYDFTLQLTDRLGRSVQWFYTLIIQ